MLQNDLTYTAIPSFEKGSPQWIREKSRADSDFQRAYSLYWCTKDVIWTMKQKYKLGDLEAFRKLLYSETYAMLSNDEMEMMMEYSPEDIFDMWECEQITGNPRNSRLF